MRLVDADELMEHVWREKLDSREFIANMIDNAPTVEEISTRIPIDVFKHLISLEPKTGYWITKDGKEQGYDIGGVKTWYMQIMCSECGFIKTAIEGRTGQYHYCPNCGAKMVEPQESEEEV